MQQLLPRFDDLLPRFDVLMSSVREAFLGLDAVDMDSEPLASSDAEV